MYSGSGGEGSDPRAAIKFLPLFTGELLTQDGVQHLAPCRRSTVFYRAGEIAGNVYLVEAGLVKIIREGVDGRDLVLQIVRAGEIFGDEGVFGEFVRESTAEVLSDGIIQVIPNNIFTEFCDKHPEMWRRVAEFCSFRGRGMERKLDLLFLRGVEERIVSTLVSLAQVYRPDADGSLNVYLSQSEIAGLVGATRETTSTVLNLMARRGLIKLGRRLVTVPLLGALRRRSGEDPGESLPRSMSMGVD